MKLSTTTRYGVRALFDIAFHNQGRPTQARDIARRQEVPLRYLEQIFQELRRANLVEAKRGPRGGYSLARAGRRARDGRGRPRERRRDRQLRRRPQALPRRQLHRPHRQRRQV